MDLGQVFTTKIISDYMVSLISKDKETILEPCFGGGAFIDACLHAGFHQIVGCELDTELYEPVKLKYPNLELLHCDFLKYSPTHLFDAIIMNPPYIRQEKIDDLKIFGITKKEIRKNPIYDGLPSTANMYMYFVIKAISLLKNGGELVVIFPGTWMDARSGKSFEKRIEQQTKIIERIFVSGDVFDENALVDVVILKLVKKTHEDAPTLEKNLTLMDGKLRETAVKNKKKQLILPIAFSEYATVRRGLTTGWNEMFINPEDVHDESVMADILSSPKSISGYTTDKANYDKLLVISDETKITNELEQYINSKKIELLQIKNPKTLYEKCIHNKKWFMLNKLDSKGILFGYIIRNDMKFILNGNDVVARDNFYIIKPKGATFVIFALLNNYYTYFQLETLGKKYGAGLLKIQRYDIENLRFINLKNVTEDDKNKLELLGKRLAETSQQCIINEITKVISNYTHISYETIMDEYTSIKKRRLGQ